MTSVGSGPSNHEGTSTAAANLFRTLRKLHVDQREKPDVHENLLDILEIIAVAIGTKPAHLNGQGFRSAALLRDVEGIADTFGLYSKRTHPVIPHWYRVPAADIAVATFQRQDSAARSRAGPDVLWVYRDANLGDAIPAVASGGDGVSQLLGYPDCCVRETMEWQVQGAERYINGLRTTYRTDDPHALIDLIRQDVGVSIEETELDKYQGTAPWRTQFPFVSYAPCMACFRTSGSPTAQANGMMRELAMRMSPEFAREIEAAVAPPMPPEPPTVLWREPLNVIKPLSVAPQEKVGRNEPCPCGSGRKYKKCHGRV